MKTKLVLIIGLLSMQPLFGRGLTSPEKTALQTASTQAALSQAINAAVAVNSPKSDDQQLIATAKTRLAAMGQQAPAPAQTTPPVTPPASTTPPAGQQPAPTRGNVAANIMSMPEFTAAQQAAQQVKAAITAQPGATPNDVATVLQAIIR